MADSEAGSSRRWLLRASIGIGVVAVIAALRATVLAPDPVEVHVVPVEIGRVESTVTNSKAGTVRARRRSRVTAETGGRVVAILHREGDHVAAGEVIVRLNDASVRAQLELARQGVHVARAGRQEACLRRDRAGRELARKQSLADEAIVSEDLLDALQFAYEAAKVSCEAARADLARAHASVVAAEAELQKTNILAPFDGVVAEVSSELGEWVTPSPPLLTSPAVVDLIDPTSLYVSAPMDEVDSANIRSGQSARISVDSRPGASFPGRVVRVAPYVIDIETQNRTLEIEVAFEVAEDAASMLPGTSADVEIVLEAREDVPRLPTSALLEGDRVLTLEDGRLVKHSVTLGLRNWSYAQLVDGLEAGAQVVTSLDRIEVQEGARAVAAEGSTQDAR